MLKMKMSLLAFGFLCISLISMPLTSFADGKPPAPSVGTPAQNPDYGGTDYGRFSPMSSQNLEGGDAYIRNVSGNEVSISGDTSSYSYVDTVGIKLYLQVWNSSEGKWVDLAYAGAFENSYDNYIFHSYTYSNVASGYYYRTKVVHYVTEGRTTEQSTNFSKYIYLN